VDASVTTINPPLKYSILTILQGLGYSKNLLGLEGEILGEFSYVPKKPAKIKKPTNLTPLKYDFVFVIMFHEGPLPKLGKRIKIKKNLSRVQIMNYLKLNFHFEQNFFSIQLVIYTHISLKSV
jgi:hypothetical protein